MDNDSSDEDRRPDHHDHHDDDGDEEEDILPSEDEDDDDDDDDRFDRFKIEMKKDAMASDLEDDDDDDDGPNDDGLPSRHAWGRDKKLYYHTDYVDKDFRGQQKQQEEDLARYEEEEAVEIQKRIHSTITDDDIGLDLLGLPKVAPEKRKSSSEQQITDDDAQEKLPLDPKIMSEKEKVSLIRQESPELELLMADLKTYQKEAAHELQPLIRGLKNIDGFRENSASNLLRIRLQCLINYCTNIAFYLAMKCSPDRNKIGKEHPIIKRLLKYKKLIGQIDQSLADKRIQREIAMVKQAIEQGDTGRLKFGPELSEPPPLPPVKPKDVLIEDDDNDEGADADENGKRAITYEMEKNKGLTPKRKREQRNPRVKYRKKFEKAVVRRKGQVREPRKEIKKYGGEITGINVRAVKSVKFK